MPSSSPPPRARYIPVTLHLAPLALTAAHHYGTVGANFNGCRRQQERMLACQGKQRPSARKDGLPALRLKPRRRPLSPGARQGFHSDSLHKRFKKRQQTQTFFNVKAFKTGNEGNVHIIYKSSASSCLIRT